MSNYFRITAYHPEQDISIIMDSNGLFEKLWQFSADLVQKGFKIVEVGNADKFLEGQIPLCEPIPDKYVLRTNAKGTPQYTTLSIDGITYKAICVESKCYVPDRTITA